MSKRGMDMQGGSERYGGSGGMEAPTETPTRASAAQLAKRKIATAKGRTARSTSPTKLGPMFQTPDQQSQSMGSQPAQPGFSFGQPQASNAQAVMSNGFSFGQSQPSTNGSFAFGQAQPSTSSTFTFGQSQPTQSGGFSFNAPTSSMSFPPANGNNPFSNLNGASTESKGFSGNIFNFGGSPASQSQPSTNGFSFGSTAGSTAPTSPAASQEQEEEKKVIQEREPYLTSAQQKQLEDMVGRHLLNSPKLYQQDPLDLLPASVLSEVAQFMRSLPPPAQGAPQSVMRLFSKPYKGKAQKPWIHDADRQEFQRIAGGLQPDQQQKLAQVVKDNVEPLRNTAPGELPGMDCLPNDVQYEMLEQARSMARPKSPEKPANVFAQSSTQTNGEDKQDKPHIEDQGDTPAKTNPFAALKSPAPTAPTPAKTPTFSFGTPAAAKSDSSPKSAESPTFSFGSTAKPAAAVPTFGAPPSQAPKAAEEDMPTKPNPFASIARPASSTPAVNGVGKSGSIASPSFSFGQSAAKPDAASVSTPAKSTFSFGQGSKTPAAPSSNIFNLGSSSAQPPATAPVQKTLPPFSASSAPAPPSRPNFTGQQQQQQPTPSSGGADRVSVPSTQGESRWKELMMQVKAFNFGFRETIKSFPLHTDWTDTAKFYLVEMEKLKKQVSDEEDAMATRQRAAAASSSEQRPLVEAPTPARAPAQEAAADSPAKRTKTTQGFQLPSPNKPLSATASRFSDILDAPDKSSAPAAAAQQSSAKPASASVFNFQSTAAPASSPAPATTASSPFKFGGSSTNGDSAMPSAPATSGFKFGTSATSATAPSSTPASSPFKFQAPSASSSSIQSAASPFKPSLPNGDKAASGAPAAPSFSMPKFGGAGSTPNFMSAFGAQAQKEANKEKAKRKAEDFDSDEDDEAEWERQDKEKQEEKRRKLNANAGKTMKMVNGSFVWSDSSEDKDDGASQAPAGEVAAPASRASFGSFSASTTGGAPSQMDGARESKPESAASKTPATPAKSGASLFDRIGKNTDGTLERDETSTTPKPTFSFGASTSGEDNTWKPETPIKFGGPSEEPGSTTPTGSPAKPMFSFTPKTNGISQDSNASPPKFNFGKPAETPARANPADSSARPMPTPKFTFGGPSTFPPMDTPKASTAAPSLFSMIPSATPATSSGTSLFASTSKDKPTGFQFGGPASTSKPAANTGSVLAPPAANSRASTPGATTADEGSTAANTDNEDAAGDAAPPEEQSDLTSLSAEEQRTEEVLFMSKARCRKFDRAAAGSWDNKGVGIIRLLKNKETGSPRVLMRLAPGGQILINANLMKEQGMYAKLGPKAVKLVFSEEAGLSTYSLSFGTVEGADDLLAKVNGVLEE